MIDLIDSCVTILYWLETTRVQADQPGTAPPEGRRDSVAVSWSRALQQGRYM